MEGLNNLERCLENDFFKGFNLDLYYNKQEVLLSIFPFQQVIFKKIESKIKLFLVHSETLYYEGDILESSSPKFTHGQFLPAILPTIVSINNKERAQKLFKNWCLKRYEIPSDYNESRYNLMQKAKDLYSNDQIKDIRLGFLKYAFSGSEGVLMGFENYLIFLFALKSAEIFQIISNPHKYIKERSSQFYIECFTKIKENSLTDKERSFLNTLSVLCSNIHKNKYFIFLPKEI